MRTSRPSEIKVSKETYYSVKRDLLQCQKRPKIRRGHEDHQRLVSKETYRVKRDPLQCQKRPKSDEDIKTISD